MALFISKFFLPIIDLLTLDTIVKTINISVNSLFGAYISTIPSVKFEKN